MVFYACGFRKPLDGTSKTGAHVSLCFQLLFLVYYCVCVQERIEIGCSRQTERCPVFFPASLYQHSHTHRQTRPFHNFSCLPLIEARSNTILAGRGYGALRFNSHGIRDWGGKKYSLCCVVVVFFISFILVWLPSFTAGSKQRSSTRRLHYTFTNKSSRGHCYLVQFAMKELKGFLVFRRHAVADWHIGWQSLLPLLLSVEQAVTLQAAPPLDDCWLQSDTRAAFW